MGDPWGLLPGQAFCEGEGGGEAEGEGAVALFWFCGGGEGGKARNGSLVRGGHGGVGVEEVRMDERLCGRAFAKYVLREGFGL